MCHSVENEKRLKLFVAGEVFSDPQKWSGLSDNKVLILAESKEQAKSMVDGLPVVEVEMDKPSIL